MEIADSRLVETLKPVYTDIYINIYILKTETKKTSRRYVLCTIFVYVSNYNDKKITIQCCVVQGPIFHIKRRREMVNISDSE